MSRSNRHWWPPAPVLEGGGRIDPDRAGFGLAVVDPAVRERALEIERVALAHHVLFLAHPDPQPALDEDEALLPIVREGLAPDMDVYDAAAVTAPGPLSEMSVAQGSAPIKFPDFTRGKWKDAR